MGAPALELDPVADRLRLRTPRKARELQASGKGRQRAGSVARRLLAILEAFSTEGPELTIAEIGLHTGIPSSTVYRLLADLTDLGAVERLTDGRYAIGLRLWEIVKRASRSERLVGAASPALRELHELTRGDVALAVLAGGDVLYVHTVHGPHPVDPEVRVGTRTPVSATSIGQVLLAYAPPDVFDLIIADGQPRRQDAARPGPNGLHHVLADVRRAGVASSRTPAGSLVIAAPVCEPSGAAVASVALSTRDGNEARLSPLVRTTGRRITRDIATPSRDITARFITQ